MKERLAKILRPHRQDSRALAVFLVLAVSTFGLIKLTSEVAEGDTFAVDKLILRGLRTAQDAAVPIGPVWLKSALVDFTALGGAPVLTLITVFAVGYLIAARKYGIAGLVAVSVSCGAIMSTLAKAFFIRPRPELVPHLVEVASTSFPSGHAMNSAIVYLTLAALLARGDERRRVQIYLITVGISLTLLIGCTRVFLGVHWPSDVLAGWAIGAAWAAGSSVFAKALQRSRRIEQP